MYQSSRRKRRKASEWAPRVKARIVVARGSRHSHHSSGSLTTAHHQHRYQHAEGADAAGRQLAEVGKGWPVSAVGAKGC